MALKPRLKNEEDKTSDVLYLLNDSTQKGRITDTLTGGIAAERQPSIFDTKEIIERDNDLQKLPIVDERKGKPVFLSDIQTRIVFALSYGISQELESEDIAKKIKNPFSPGNKINRLFDIYSLSSLIFNSVRKRYREQIVTELCNLSRIPQSFYYEIECETGKRTIKFFSPLITIDGAFLNANLNNSEKSNNIEIIQETGDDFVSQVLKEKENIKGLFIGVGVAFFSRLDDRFSAFTPKLFEVWRKGKRQTELFRTLLASLHHAYSHYKIAANKAEQRVKKENKTLNLSSEQLKAAIAEARKAAMTFELNISTIKQRVTTDYDSKRCYKTKFKKDLQNAIEGFKELGIIEEAYIHRGAKGQEKVSFILSETYAAAAEQKVNEIQLLKAPDKEEQISAF